MTELVHPRDEARRIRAALLERAIERLTRAMGTVGDGDVADLVRERASMRAELEALTRDWNVVGAASKAELTRAHAIAPSLRA